MSSFKRKASSKPIQGYSGTRILPGSTQTLLTSTGIASLDDVLGGGLPLTCSLVIAAPDVHSSYGELVLRYFVSQGLVSGHRVCLIGGSEDELGRFVRDCVWLPKDFHFNVDDDEEGEGKEVDLQKVKIAWRYEKMKQFKTTVGNLSPYVVISLGSCFLKHAQLVLVVEMGSRIAKRLTYQVRCLKR
jgi:elongator complex protein 4